MGKKGRKAREETADIGQKRLPLQSLKICPGVKGAMSFLSATVRKRKSREV